MWVTDVGFLSKKITFDSKYLFILNLLYLILYFYSEGFFTTLAKMLKVSSGSIDFWWCYMYLARLAARCVFTLLALECLAFRFTCMYMSSIQIHLCKEICKRKHIQTCLSLSAWRICCKRSKAHVRISSTFFLDSAMDSLSTGMSCQAYVLQNTRMSTLPSCATLTPKSCIDNVRPNLMNRPQIYT